MTQSIPLKPDDFVLRRESGTLVVQINRAEKKNALTLAMWGELGRLFRSIAADRDVRAVVLCGAGEVFSTGADLAEFDAVRATPEQAEIYEREVNGCLDAIADVPQPTIAAITGACVAGGVALAQACDFRFADAMAYFSVAAARVGIVYDVGKCRPLISTVGLARAKRILLTGKRFSLDEAHAWGFVDEKVEQGAVLKAATAFAAEFDLCAPLAVAGMKLVLNAIAADEVERRSADINRAIYAAQASADHREAISAFAARRKPVFRGR